jgi:hypothetical protein
MEPAMEFNGAAESFVDTRRSERDTPFALRHRSGEVDSDIIELAAEALFQFVFSGCDSLDGGRHWTDGHEDTKAGFRAEAAAVLKAVWPAVLCSRSRSLKSRGAADELDRRIPIGVD